MRLEPIVLLALAGVLACEDVDGGRGPADAGEAEGDDTGSPSADAVERCRDACDDELLFDCIDADVHELCWNACPERGDVDTARPALHAVLEDPSATDRDRTEAQRVLEELE